MGGHRIIGSAAVLAELEDIKDYDKRNAIEEFYYSIITDDVETTEKCYNRADVFIAAGLGIMDSQHLAIAEAIGADFLLTVDKAFISKSNALKLSTIKVMNPIDILKKGII
jgi:predicted nucleic acid-binding protein